MYQYLRVELGIHRHNFQFGEGKGSTNISLWVSAVLTLKGDSVGLSFHRVCEFVSG